MKIVPSYFCFFWGREFLSMRSPIFNQIVHQIVLSWIIAGRQIAYGNWAKLQGEVFQGHHDTVLRSLSAGYALNDYFAGLKVRCDCYAALRPN